MKISSDDIAPILTALGTLLTVVGGVVVNLIMTLRQGRKLEEHKAAIEQLKSTSGTFKTIKPPDGP